jgi:hypothetical protein
MNTWNLRNSIHIDYLRELSNYEQFCYGFFAVICLALGMVVHINQNFEMYDYYLGEIVTKLYTFMVRVGIAKDHEELPLYAPLHKCNSEHDVHNIIAITVKPENIKKKNVEKLEGTPEELV